jgi:two-component system cell cycle sensor histidine kinase/response regulator CckA
MADAKPTILLVDDDRAILTLLVRALETRYSVIEASNGRQAVELFGERSDEIDVVLLDLAMPEMSGYEALAQMQVADPDVKVIVVTGAEAQPDRLPGILGVLTKPFLAEQVLTVVDDVLNAFQ